VDENCDKWEEITSSRCAGVSEKQGIDSRREVLPRQPVIWCCTDRLSGQELSGPRWNVPRHTGHDYFEIESRTTV
jgi:hypothetical protein